MTRSAHGRRAWTAGFGLLAGCVWLAAEVLLSPAATAAGPVAAGQPTPGGPVPGIPHSWAPTDEQMQSALRLVDEFFAARDRGDYAGAYSLLTRGLQSRMPFDRFRTIARDFTAMAGAVKERRITTMSWGLDVPGALPGVMVSIDYFGRFETISRHCGYIILNEQSKGTFRIARVEDNFLTNDVVRGASPEAVDKAWAELSKSCPAATGSQPKAPSG